MGADRLPSGSRGAIHNSPPDGLIPACRLQLADGRLSGRPRAAARLGPGQWLRSGLRTLVETQQLRLFEQLRLAGKQPVTLDRLRAGGIDFPAVVIGELELNGYVIERVHEHGRLLGVRLLEPEVPNPPAARRRRRWR
jgi:hypothetical protein